MEMFGKVFGQSVEDRFRETSEVRRESLREQGQWRRSRAGRRWMSIIWITQRLGVGARAVRKPGRRRTAKQRGGEGWGAPTVSLDNMYARSEQKKEEEKGTPISLVKYNKTKMVMAKVALVQECPVEIVRKFAEQWDTEK